MTTHAPLAGRRKVDAGLPFVYLVALVIVGVTIAPVVYVVIGGFRTTGQINADPGGWPDPWVLDKYAGVFSNPNFWTQFLNSSIVALLTTAGVVLLGVMAAFVIARYSFRGRNVLFSLFTAGLLFPLTVAVLPLFTMLRGLGLLGSLAAVIIPQIAFALPTTIIILVPFLRAIPDEIEEAAFIDGCSRLGFFFRMVVRLSLPGVITVGILAFIGAWNSYLLPLFILNDPSTFTLPLGVQAFSSQYSVDTARVLAFTALSMLPALIFFSLFERRIVGGLTGAVKG